MVSDNYPKADEIQIKGSQIFSQVRKKWLPLTPEERVRQEYLKILIQEYGYDINQFAEEINVTDRGSAQAAQILLSGVQSRINGKINHLLLSSNANLTMWRLKLEIMLKAKTTPECQMRRFLLPIIPVKQGTGASRKIRCPVTLKR